MNEIRYADLFGGVGGFRLGIERANNAWDNNRSDRKTGKFKGVSGEFKESEPSTKTKCVFYSDIDKYSVKTYNKNFKENHEPTDITKIRTEDIPELDMVCGGFPCQAFSIAGKRRGFEDTRGTLFFEVARIIKAKRPKIVFLENVKGLLNHNKGETFRTILQTISELGYDVQWMVLNSKFFGVPQNRERVFIIGSLRGECRPEILPFRETNEEDRKQPVSTAIDKNYWEGVDNHGQRTMISNYYGGFGEGLRESNISPTIRTPKGGGHLPMVKIANPVQLVNKNRAKKPYNPNNREMKLKIRDDETSYTVKSATHEFMVKQNMKIRRLTPMECERLQGFPDGWTEGVSDTQRYKQMGNAVTVNVIEAIATRLFF